MFEIIKGEIGLWILNFVIKVNSKIEIKCGKCPSKVK